MKEKLDMIQNNLIRILEASDEKTQSDKAIEELSELIRAIIRYRQFPFNTTTGEIADVKKAYTNLVEEIADVQIMLYQLIELYDISDEEIYNVMIAKTERTIERLGGK